MPFEESRCFSRIGFLNSILWVFSRNLMMPWCKLNVEFQPQNGSRTLEHMLVVLNVKFGASSPSNFSIRDDKLANVMAMEKLWEHHLF